MKRILIISTSTYAGMGPYACEIINSFHVTDNVFFFLIEDEKHYFSNNIRKELLDKAILLYRKNNRINKFLDLLYPSKAILDQFYDFSKKNNIEAFHFLTSDIPYYPLIKKICKKYPVYFTVHDLHPHESKKIFYKQIKQNILYKKLEKIREFVPFLITNSYSQYDELQKLYPDKSIYYHNFPTLISNSIIIGNNLPKELNGVNNYILFFGRFEYYKGIHLLYNAFVNNPKLKAYTLVLAGSGQLNFERQYDKEQNIIIINRYIDDSEIKRMYTNSILNVYPYISATQSGVLSLSCYFNIPILASNISFFEQVSKDGIGKNFRCNDIADLANNIIDLLEKTDLEEIKNRQKSYYKLHYSKKYIRNILLQIYNK